MAGPVSVIHAGSEHLHGRPVQGPMRLVMPPARGGCGQAACCIGVFSSLAFPAQSTTILQSWPIFLVTLLVLLAMLIRNSAEMTRELQGTAEYPQAGRSTGPPVNDASLHGSARTRDWALGPPV